MRNTLLLFCLGLCLTGCGLKGEHMYREMEKRTFPDPALGTENPESQWYKTQQLAAPPEPVSPASAGSAAPSGKPMPARLSAKPVPTTPAPPSMGPTGAK